MLEDVVLEKAATEEAASGGFTLRVWRLLYPSKGRFLSEVHESKFSSTILSFIKVPAGSSGNVSELNFEHPVKTILLRLIKCFKKCVSVIGALVMVSWVKDVGNITVLRTLQSIKLNDSIFDQSIFTFVKAPNFSMDIADFAVAAATPTVAAAVPSHPVITIDVRVGCSVLTIPAVKLLFKNAR